MNTSDANGALELKAVANLACGPAFIAIFTLYEMSKQLVDQARVVASAIVGHSLSPHKYSIFIIG